MRLCRGEASAPGAAISRLFGPAARQRRRTHRPPCHASAHQAPGSSRRGRVLRLKQLRTRCPELDAVADCVTAFGAMRTNRHGHLLPAWLHQAEATGFKPLRGLARATRAILSPSMRPHKCCSSTSVRAQIENAIVSVTSAWADGRLCYPLHILPYQSAPVRASPPPPWPKGVRTPRFAPKASSHPW